MNRLRRVLCPVDVMDPWHPALAFAAILANEFQSVLDAVYVAERRESRTPRLFSPRAHDVEKSMTAHNLTQDLKSLVDARAPGVPVTTEVRSGHPLKLVLAEASRRRSDLIIVGGPKEPQAWRCTARFTDRLASDAPCPVLTVPGRHSPGKPARILLGVDFSEATTVAVEWTALLARRFDALVEVLHAERGLAGARSELEKIESRFASLGVRATTRAARGASVLAEVVGRSADDPFELVIIGAERGGSARLDVSFLERLRKLVRTPVLSIVGKADSQPMPSPDAVARLRELLPPALEPVSHPQPA